MSKDVETYYAEILPRFICPEQPEQIKNMVQVIAELWVDNPRKARILENNLVNYVNDIQTMVETKPHG